MTTIRTNYLYQFKGKILTKRLAQASPTSKYSGQSYYVLTIQQTNQTKKSLQVFPSKLSNPQILPTLKKSSCFGKKYLFFCRNQKGYYYLVNWEELPSNEGTANGQQLKPKPAIEKSEPIENNHDLN